MFTLDILLLFVTNYWKIDSQTSREAGRNVLHRITRIEYATTPNYRKLEFIRLTFKKKSEHFLKSGKKYIFNRLLSYHR